jgi:hypothetical protein
MPDGEIKTASDIIASVFWSYGLVGKADIYSNNCSTGHPMGHTVKRDWEGNV